ncbi:MAG: hypothetical protein CMH27_11440 [Micavibrio sp.]|nr:hypothetical protein [Micavibrio sp.]|tara:strand:+ start:1417 stop:1809 length:393 start_codon:yes stop_codon:yes gene_type:complete
MTGLMNFLRNILYKLGVGSPPAEDTAIPSQVPERTQPRMGKIDQEVVFAMRDGYMVLMVDHQFDGVPSWIEWDNDRKTVSFTQMGGDMDEMNADIKVEYIDALMDAKKVLLVSNDNEKKIVHFVPFIARK